MDQGVARAFFANIAWSVIGETLGAAVAILIGKELLIAIAIGIVLTALGNALISSVDRDEEDVAYA